MKSRQRRQHVALSEGAKQIGAHACDITYFVAHIIRNDAWVLR